MPFAAEHKNLPRDYRRAQDLRKQSSLAEQKMWLALRQFGKQIGMKFRRQQPVHPYVVDFICFDLKLIIELDGASHDNTQKQDLRRTALLEKQGYEVVRYANEDVLRNLEGVIETLRLKIGSLRHEPLSCPPPQGGRNPA